MRLLGPRSFESLRLNRNRNKLTKKEQTKLRGLRVGVIGASAGHSIAHVLAMEGIVGELRLADFDDIELTNLNRIPAGVMDLGVNKAVVLARRVAEIDPYLPVTTFTDGITPENLARFIDGLDLIIEECDSLDIKFLVREAARESGIAVLMETSDRGVLDVERFDLEAHRPIFHGLLGDMSYEKLAGLTTEQKGPFVLQSARRGRRVSARGGLGVGVGSHHQRLAPTRERGDVGCGDGRSRGATFRTRRSALGEGSLRRRGDPFRDRARHHRSLAATGAAQPAAHGSRDDQP